MRVPLFLFTAGMIAHGVPLVAQGVTATVRVNLPVTDPVTVLDASASTTDFGTVGGAELNAGFVNSAGPLIRVRSNRAFAVSISAAAGTFGPGNVSASDVQWSLTSGGPYTALATTPVTVVSSGTGSVVTQSLSFRMLLALASDPPGTYQLGLALTLSVP